MNESCLLLFKLWKRTLTTVICSALWFACFSQDSSEEQNVKDMISVAGKYKHASQYDEAFEVLDSALSICLNIDQDALTAEVYMDLGIIGVYRSNYSDALRHLQSALMLGHDLQDTALIAESYNLIAAVHHNQADYRTAFEYYNLSLNLTEAQGSKRQLGVLINNLGSLHEDLQEFDLALDYHKKSLDIWHSISDTSWVLVSLWHIGECYRNIGKPDLALEAFNESYQISQKLGTRINVIEVSNAIGQLHNQLQGFEEALKWCSLAYDLSIEENNVVSKFDASQCLVNVYEGLGDHKLALKYHKLAAQYKDSIYGQKKTKELTQLEMNFQFEREQLADSLEYVKATLIQDKKISNQRIGLFSVGIITLIMIALAMAIYLGKRKSDNLLLNILPAEVADELKERGHAKAKKLDNVTVLFTDFKGFTSMSEMLSPEELVQEIHHCFSVFDSIMEKYDIEKIKTIGDAYMAASGVPTSKETHAVDVVNAAIEMRDFVLRRAGERRAEGRSAFEMRIGVNTGTVIAGIVGTKKFQYDIWGDTVNTAARLESSGEAGKVNISNSTYQLVKNSFECQSRGQVEAKGKGEIEMYFVLDKA